LASKGNYPDAINKLNSAKACDETRAIEVDERIQKLFAEIRKEKQKAIHNQGVAIRAKIMVQKMFNDLQAAQKKQKEAEDKSDSTEKRRQKDLLSIQNAIKSGKSNEELNRLADTLKTRRTLPPTASLIVGKQPTDAASAQPANDIIKTRESSRMLWAEIRATLNSLSKLQPEIKFKSGRDGDFNYPLEAKLRDSICSDGESYCKKIFFGSSKTIDSLTKFNKNIEDDLMFKYLRSAYYYAWQFLDNNQYRPGIEIINKAENIITDKQLSAKFYFCLAGFENAKGYYSSHLKDGEEIYNHSNRAIVYANKAVLKEPDNKYYLKSLSTFLRNVKDNMPDSLLSKEEKDNYFGLSAQLANFINGIDNKGFATANIFYCVGDRVQEQVNYRNYPGAEKILDSSITEFNKFIANDPNDYSKLIFRARLYLKIADIRLKLNDTIGKRDFTNKALDDWISYIKGNKLLLSDIIGFESTYDAIVTGFGEVYKDRALIAKYGYMSNVLDGLKPFYAKQQRIAIIIYYLNNFIGNQDLTYKNPKDSIDAVPYYSRAVNGFESSNILDGYSKFSEDYARFLLLFNKSIKLDIKYDYDQKAADSYDKMNKLFLPVYQKYPFDVNIGYYITEVNKQYGEYLYKKGRYEDAIGPLDSASYNGEKQSTEYLIKIYNTSGHADTVKSNYYRLRDQSQSDGRKEYTHAADFNGFQKNIIIDIFDRAKGYPYKGIADQAQWWRIARNAIIPQDLVDEFSRLQDIAWQNNTSFKELVTERINAPVLNEYKDLKDRINGEKNLTEKLRLFDALSVLYDTNLKKDAINSDVIKKDAIEFYLKNAKLLVEDKQFIGAKNLYNEVLKLNPGSSEAKEGKARINFEQNRNNLNALVGTANNDELKLYLNFCVEDGGNKKNALIIINKMHIELDKAYLKINSTDSVSAKTDLSNRYNDLAWNCLLFDITDNTFDYLNKSIKLDPANLYPRENMPHVYLLTGQFEKAKAMYLKLKDKEFDNNNNLPTFKDAFLGDLKQFRSRGIKNDGIQKMINILEAK